MLEAECRAFWNLAQSIRLMDQHGADSSLFRDDLDVVRLYTDHPGIKNRAAAILADVPALRAAAV